MIKIIIIKIIILLKVNYYKQQKQSSHFKMILK